MFSVQISHPSKLRSALKWPRVPVTGILRLKEHTLSRIWHLDIWKKGCPESRSQADGVAEVRFKGAVAHRAAAANQVAGGSVCNYTRALQLYIGGWKV